MLNEHFHVDLWIFLIETAHFNCFLIFWIFCLRKVFLEFLNIFYKSLVFTKTFWAFRKFLDGRYFERFVTDEIQEVFRLLLFLQSFLFKFWVVTVWSWGGVRKDDKIFLSRIFHIWRDDICFRRSLCGLGTTV